MDVIIMLEDELEDEFEVFVDDISEDYFTHDNLGDKPNIRKISMYESIKEIIGKVKRSIFDRERGFLSLPYAKKEVIKDEENRGYEEGGVLSPIKPNSGGPISYPRFGGNNLKSFTEPEYRVM